jgi:CheY-like chemotaxis protein
MATTKMCKIMVVSDFDWEFSIRRRLDLGGCPDDKLSLVASGQEALVIAEQEPPDMIIYGLLTLDMDGYEFCRRLKWIPALQDVPVLLVGWISPKIVYPRARRAGAAGYLYSAVYAQGLIAARNALARGELYYPPELYEATGPGAPPDQEGACVLVIDDNPAMADIVCMTLGRERNDEVRYADSGPKGLDAARQNPPDLVILDIMMPGWDGFETHRQFRMTSGLEEVPFIFQTAYAQSYETARSLGAAGCLLAPYSTEDLLAARDAALWGDSQESISGPEPP